MNLKDWKAQWLRREWQGVDSSAETTQRAGVAIVNFNTRELFAHLLFSLHRVLDPSSLGPIVVVDNASSDGSVPLLQSLEKAGLIHLITNGKQRYHGPALNQAMGRLRVLSGNTRRRHAMFRYVWVLDSDTLVLRSDCLRDAIGFLKQERAALIGEHQPDPIIPEGYAHVSSLLMDPSIVWRRAYKPFEEHGDPAQSLQISLRAAGIRIGEFPFKKQNYILHIGRATLAKVKEAMATDNRYYSWAAEHFQPHYSGNSNGAAIREEFLRIFNEEVPTLTAETLIDACLRPERIELPLAHPVESAADLTKSTGPSR
jgi:hypothetical protein